MKKSVVSALTAAVILGTASAPAFAAQNPFSDVNDHHWAYQSILGLAEAGIITGYDNSDASLNGKFVGNRNITRYEMAQMIAKTLARIEGETSPFAIQLRGHQWTFVDNSGVRRVVDGTVVPFKLGGATVDMNKLNELEALVYELQDELATLGVRVDDLRDHSDKVTWHGKIEYTYGNLKWKNSNREKQTSNGAVFRLEPVAYIDDNCWVATGNDLAPGDDGYRHGHWSARARFDANLNMDEDITTDAKLKRVWAQGDWNKFSVKLGRFGFCPPEEGVAIDTVVSGGELTFGSKWKAVLTAGRIGARSDEAHYSLYGNTYSERGEDVFVETKDNHTNVVGVHVQYDDPGDRGFFGGAGYFHAKDDDFRNRFYSDDGDTNKASIWTANLGYRFNDMAFIKFSGARNGKADTEKTAWDVLARYGNYADASEKGQWAVWLGYSKFGTNAAIASNQTDDIQTGSKGWHVGAAWAPFKNVGVLARYADGKYITGGAKYKKIFARAEFFF
ncbi:MAG: putative porin [Selenomonadaceae bacterium]|nr:putative porin [Selenomonadaceae bacterium]